MSKTIKPTNDRILVKPIDGNNCPNPIIGMESSINSNLIIIYDLPIII